MALLYILERYSNSILNPNPIRSSLLNNITTIRLTEYTVNVAEDIIKDTINTDYEIIMEVLIKAHFEVIVRRNTTYMGRQITG